ncbi:hypothetical protein [Rhodovibrio salinarum]|uniref:Uncharacterized protein n=1 Tax=Rhodovibrio salinarum TaxID=1087 RepID=A0A934QGH7_9PROT|nr:hypothetical protein [Rhodovibrio salinarum]MBK1696369.1 hypothetical protein [Rhodovibrio salinarum]
MTTLFADGIHSVARRSGVLRIALSRTDANGEPQAAGQLLLPEAEAHAFLAVLQEQVAEPTDPNAPSPERSTHLPKQEDDEDIGDLAQ